MVKCFYFLGNFPDIIGKKNGKETQKKTTTKPTGKVDNRFKKDARFKHQKKQSKPKLDERFASKLTTSTEKNIDKYGREIEDDQLDIIKQHFNIDDNEIENLSEKQLEKMIEENETNSIFKNVINY